MVAKIEQLDLFDEPEIEGIESDSSYKDTLIPFEIGNRVRVQISITEEEDPESFYYLKAFEKKRGLVLEVITKPTLQYKIQFGDQETYLYHHELKI
ncbi:hypothetical protein ACFWGC_26890 [Cytobacillus pseudoceanisediminis]|uniref:hypothetical protein n=1 Tax=Cytobacillus pseudoceanisediminis TaxID=3051614 RepID=UPI003663C150